MNDRLLEVRDIHIKFPNKEIINDPVNNSFYVNPGEFVVILGDNGVGKSSLLKTIIKSAETQPSITQKIKNKFTKIKESKIECDRTLIYKGKRIEKQSELDEFKSSIGYATQEDEDDTLFYTTVREYIYDYCENQSSKKIIDDEDGVLKQEYEIKYNILFKRLKCEQYADGKLNDRKLKVCSGGEKRMVSILRAFSRYNSDLYILDEPINNLDAKHARILNNYIKELKEQGKAILIITHCRMFQNVDRSYAIMKKGIYELNGENSYKPQSCYGNCDNGCYEED